MAVSMGETMATICGMMTFAQIKAGDVFRKKRNLIFVSCDDGVVVIGYNPKTPLKKSLKVLREMCAGNGFKKEVIDTFIAEARRHLTSRHYALYFMIPMPSIYPFPLMLPNNKETLPTYWDKATEFAGVLKSSGVRIV